MLFDLLDTSNLASYNVKLAQVIGLAGAVYLNQLITIQNKATKKSKIDDEGYFDLSRTFITSQTTLTKSQQESIDNDLIKLEILSKKDNKLKLNLDVIGSIITNDDKKLNSDLSKIAKANKECRAEAKKASVLKALKNNITIKDVELTPALEDWVEVCYENNVKINKVTIKKFIEDLNSTTQGDLDMALSLVKVAASNCYTTLAWAYSKWLNERSVQVKQTQNTVRSVNSTEKLTEVEF